MPPPRSVLFTRIDSLSASRARASASRDPREVRASSCTSRTLVVEMSRPESKVFCARFLKEKDSCRLASVYGQSPACTPLPSSAAEISREHQPTLTGRSSTRLQGRLVQVRPLKCTLSTAVTASVCLCAPPPLKRSTAISLLLALESAVPT